MQNDDNILYLRKPDNDDAKASYRRISNGDGGDGGDMWQQSVETRLSELRQDVAQLRSDVNSGFGDIRQRFNRVDDKFGEVREKQERDFRLLFAALITVALGLAALMAKGFQWI